MAFPEKVDYVIVGAGIHGLSTAWHLAAKLKAKGKGDGSKIVVIDKDSIAAGASGIACGVVRNNYCLLYTSPSPRDRQKSRMPSSA